MSVKETMSRVLGETVWKAISFYFDPRAMASDPDAFSQVFGGLFGTHAKVLEKVIGDDLMARTGVPEDKRRVSDFRSFVRAARSQFISAASGIVRTH